MIIKRIFNNNVVLVETKTNDKRILLGNGIGFGHKVNQHIDITDDIEVYVLESTSKLDVVENFVNNVPAKHLILTKKIVEMAQEKLCVKFDDSIYIGLADHINYAIERAQRGEYLSNAMLWEIMKFYKKEFLIAEEAIKMINLENNVNLDDEEAGFIAMHFVNAQCNSIITENSKIMSKINTDVLNIIKNHYKIQINEDSLNYARFRTHLRFFLRRAHSKSIEEDSYDKEIFDKIRQKYPGAYECALKLKHYVNQSLGMEMTDNEILYFMLHIQRLTQREV